MKSYLIITLVVICLMSSLAEPVLAQMGMERPMGEQQMLDQGRAFDMMRQGKQMRAGQGMHGLGFMHSGGNAFGEYVTFTVDTDTGNVLNYGIAGTQLFDISIANFDYESTSEMGSLTRISNTDGSTFIQLHDNPAAVINILTSESISVTFTLADNVTATKENDFIRIESGSIVGYIVGSGTIDTSVSGTKVNVDASANSAIVFRISPVNMPVVDHMYRRFSQEIARNRVGMEIAFGRNRSFNAINYSEGMRLNIREMERDRIRLLINATEPSGRMIGINLDNSSLVIGPGQRLRIHYDDRPLNCVDNPDTVFNGTDEPLCWISPIQERVRAQLMIHIPNFSEHIIDIVVEEEEPVATETITGTPTATETAETPEAPGFGIVMTLAGLITWRYVNRCYKK